MDKEIKVISDCIELLSQLSSEERVRALDYIIRRFGDGSLNQNLTNQNVTSNQVATTQFRPTQTASNGSAATPTKPEYPTLNDLLIKNYPKSEAEWILVFSYYASNYGSAKFTKEDIKAKYNKIERLTPNNSKNFATNLKNCIKKDWIKSVNETEFIMIENGNSHAMEVISGKSTTKERKPTSRKKRDEQ